METSLSDTSRGAAGTGGRPQDGRPIASLAEVCGAYDAIFCDVWGVVHNGVVKHPAAEAALTAARQRGIKVVLLTNSPRPAAGVVAQLDMMDLSRDCYDAIVTSGDATRALIADVAGPVFHIGPERDYDLFEGIDVELVGETDAAAVIVTGLNNDEVETPEDYAGLLARLQALGLPMICANPDIVVHRGERLIPCSGALARDYEAIGGTVRLAGKPHRPIYDVASRIVDIASPSRVLAIGDGLMTDVKGANDFGPDALLITDGIHGEELAASESATQTVAAVLRERGLTARYFMAALT
ncbi:TIGR01459 family HAD-type hydrolase [Aurantimonas sp. A2-1-M11]|uniref:TIGR01459 family HAD-type hydrolase n=1 Tax=Aurantimonas sp. A2-1-M11 TaxID=3113712 RepID=UPI002F95547F